MAKEKLTDYDSTAANNLDVGGISVAEGMLPSGVNNAIRELMSHQADAFGAGTPLYVDQTNNRVGIGNAAPATALTVDANGATVATFDRATSDGTIIDLQKDGTTVGSIAVNSGNNLQILGAATDHAGLEFGTSEIIPRSNGANSDGTINLGVNVVRFKDLYLSGGVYLGGTGSANYLDDYEEGTWTVNVYKNGSALAVQTRYGHYTKIGNLVYVAFYWYNSSGLTTTGSTEYTIQGIPFTLLTGSANGNQFIPAGYVYIQSNRANTDPMYRWQANSTNALHLYGVNATTNVSSGVLEFSGTGVLRVA